MKRGLPMFDKWYRIKLTGKGDVGKFLADLTSKGIQIRSLSIDHQIATFRTDRKGLAQLRKHRRAFRLKFTVTGPQQDSGAKRIILTPLFLIACAIPFACSFFLWTVQVESDRPEVVDRIEAKLEAASIVPLRPLALLPEEGEIRRSLMKNDPSLSWIRFRKVGTSLTVIPMLSPPSNRIDEPAGPPSNLVARTGGVITRFELEKGERVGRVHQTVRKGDVLATGVLEQGSKTVIVGAEGEIYADYWMEYQFSIPRTITYQMQGEEIVELSFRAPWKKEGKVDLDSGERTFPWPFIQTKRYTNELTGKLVLEEGMEKSVILPLLKNKFLSAPSSKAIIKDEKILHVSFDNDKVSGTVLFLINDDIATKRPISQGD